MKKFRLTNRILIPCSVAAMLLFALGAYLTMNMRAETDIVNISEDGRVIRTLDLSHVDKAYTIDLGGNILLVERDGVTMSEADCPDKLCVKQGKLKNGFGAIVCLPNKIMVEFSSSDTDVDAVTGAR